MNNLEHQGIFISGAINPLSVAFIELLCNSKNRTLFLCDKKEDGIKLKQVKRAANERGIPTYDLPICSDTLESQLQAYSNVFRGPYFRKEIDIIIHTVSKQEDKGFIKRINKHYSHCSKIITLNCIPNCTESQEIAQRLRQDGKESHYFCFGDTLIHHMDDLQGFLSRNSELLKLFSN